MSGTPAPLAPEDDLIVAAARAYLGTGTKLEVLERMRRVGDWSAALDRAEHHGMLPILAHVLASLPKGTVEVHAEEDLGARLRVAQARALRVEAEARRVVGLLAHAGLRPIVLKGLSLSRTLYEDPALRPFGDVDLLLEQRDWPVFREVMRADGAVPLGHDDEKLPARLIPEDALDHWCAYETRRGLGVDCGFDALELGLAMREGGRVREHAVPLPAVPGARMLSDEDQLVMLCCHLNRHGFARLIWFLDVALLLRERPRIDWSEVRRIAAREGVMVCVHETLAVVADLLAMPADRALRMIRPSWLRGRLWRSVWEPASVASFAAPREGPLVFRKARGRLGPLEYTRSIALNALLMGRTGDKLRFLVRKIAPTGEFLRAQAHDGGGTSRYLTLYARRLRRGVRSAPDALGPAGRFNTAIGWNAVSKLGTRGLQFFVTIVLARLLLPADFGLLGMAMIVTGLVVMFAEFGFAHALIQKLEISDEDICTAMSVSVVLGTAVTLLCFAAAPLIAMLFRNDALVWPLRGMSLGMFIVSFAITPRALLYRRMDFRSTAFADLTGSVTYAVVSISLALAGLGIWSLVAGSLLMALAQAVALWRRADYRFRLLLDRGSLLALAPFGAKVFASNLVDFLRGNLDYFVVGRALGPGALGLYTIAFKTADFPRQRLGAIVGDVSLPAMSSLQEDRERLKRTYVRSVTMTALVTFPLLLGVASIASEFVSAVYGPKWLGSVPALQALLPVGMLLAISQSGQNVLIASGKPGSFLSLSIAYCACVGVFSAAGVAWGIDGVAIGVALATVVYFAGFQVVLWRKLRLGPLTTLRAVLVPLLASVPMIGAVLAFRRTVAFPDGVGGGLLWLAGAAAIGAVVFAAVALPLGATMRTGREPSGRQHEGHPDNRSPFATEQAPTG